MENDKGEAATPSIWCLESSTSLPLAAWSSKGLVLADDDIGEGGLLEPGLPGAPTDPTAVVGGNCCGVGGGVALDVATRGMAGGRMLAILNLATVAVNGLAGEDTGAEDSGGAGDKLVS